MRRQWSLPLLAADGLLLLATLYMPWLEPRVPATQPGPLLDLFTAPSIDGWATRVGDAAALSDLLLVGLAILALRRPSLERRLPLTLAALLAFYLAVAVGAQARSTADATEQAQHGLHFDYAYGAYLGVAAALVVLLGAVSRWVTPARLDALQTLATLAIGGLLVSFLLPWGRSPFFPATSRGIASPAAVAAAATAIWLLGRWWARRKPGLLVPTGCTALLAGAAFGTGAFPEHRQYGAWIGLGCALALLPLVLAAGVSVVRPRLSLRDAATSTASALLVTSLFLPWQTTCLGKGTGFRQLSGRCFSANGWSTLGTVAAELAFVALLLPVIRRRPLAPVELAVGTGLLVATAGFSLLDVHSLGVRYEPGTGSTVGFAAAAALVVLLLVWLRPHRVRPLALAPISVCVAYLVVVVLPWWDVLPSGVEQELRFGEPSWLTAAGVVLALHLAWLWARANPALPSELVVLWPLGLLALAVVDLIRLRDGAFTWGEGLVVACCLLLLASGWVEHRKGLEDARLPDLLRVDRI